MDTRVDLVLEPELHAASRARNRVASELPELPGRLRDDVLVVVSELVTNAVLHGSGRVHLVVLSDVEHLLISVEDDRATFGARTPDSRGLDLVAALSTACGVHPSAHGKTAWAELPVAAGARRSSPLRGSR